MYKNVFLFFKKLFFLIKIKVICLFFFNKDYKVLRMLFVKNVGIGMRMLDDELWYYN